MTASSPVRLGGAARTPAVQVPILVYHMVDASGNIHSVTPQHLDAQCEWLIAHGYTAITVRAFWRAARGGAEFPPNPVILTNDDGGTTTLTFARILRRHGLIGTYFVNNISPLHRAQIRWLARRGDVQAHTVSHIALSGLDDEHQIVEIAANRRYLEQVTRAPVRFLAWPYGDTNERAIRSATEAGIVAAFGLGGVPVDLETVDRYAIPRISVFVDDDLAAFAAKVRGEA